MYAAISRGPSTANILKLFDAPAPMAHIPMRQPTLSPLQALFVMNSAFVQEQAKALAEQVANPLPRRKFSSCIEGSSRGTPPPLK